MNLSLSITNIMTRPPIQTRSSQDLCAVSGSKSAANLLLLGLSTGGLCIRLLGVKLGVVCIGAIVTRLGGVGAVVLGAVCSAVGVGLVPWLWIKK